MEYRLSRIVTRSGDDGSTGLADGRRCSKAAARVHALGEVDELNSWLGLLLCEALPAPTRALLTRIQHDLFDLGGELALPGAGLLGDAHLQRLDEALQQANAELPPLREFILPGGTRAAAQAHVCRTVARRAERALVALRDSEAEASALDPGLRYLNRLSDLLFVLARQLNAGGAETAWQHQRGAGPASNSST